MGLCVLHGSSSAGTAADILPLLKSVRGMSLLDGTTPPLGMRGHYIDTKPGHRRMTAVGSNQNKAITKRLASAGHYQQARTLQRPMHPL
jgi:hypothetical protein